MTAAATMMIVNARVLTMDADFPRADCIAISGGTILAVGTAADLSHLRGPDTDIIDAGGGSVLPGFSENHLHVFSGSAELAHLQLGGVHGFDALAIRLRAYAEARPDDAILFCQGCDYLILGPDRTLDRHVLDRIIPNRPVALFAPDHHTLWTNTRGLEMAGLLKGATLRPGNEIVMGEDGLATGELREMEAFAPLTSLSGYDRYRLGLSTGGEPDPFPVGAEFEQDLEVMRQGLDYCASFGITTLQNMDGNLYQLQLLDEIRRRDGHLKARVKIPFHYKNFMSLDMLDKAEMMARAYQDEWLSSGLVKVFYDGVIDSGTAVMIEPYADEPGVCGEPLFSPEEFRRIAVEADRRGLQIAVHAIGDGAVRAVLDGYESARDRNGIRDSRHRIEHIEVVHPDDIGRFAELGVIASMQPPHPPGLMGFPLEPTISKIGKERWPYSYAWRTLKNAGAHIPFASDWPVSPLDPILGIQAAVTRQKWSGDDPDQSFSLMEAIAAYTLEGAWAEHAEDRKGMIRPGYVADLVVLDGDIENTMPKQLHEVRPSKTICGGRITFSAT